MSVNESIQNTVFNANMVDTLTNLVEMKQTVDCIITDPPYKTTPKGCSGNSGGMLQKDINKKGQVFKHNDCDIRVWLPLCYKVLKETGHFYIMTNHKNLHEYLNVAKENGLHFIKSIIWNKGNKIMGQYYMSQFEYILFFRKGAGVKINNCGTPDILNVPNTKTKNKDGKNMHDTEKPVELMKILIENSTKKGEIVLDPFAGYGSVPIACMETGRNFIGVEIDKEYYERTLDRIDNYIKKEVNKCLLTP